MVFYRRGIVCASALLGLTVPGTALAGPVYDRRFGPADRAARPSLPALAERVVPVAVMEESAGRQDGADRARGGGRGGTLFFEEVSAQTGLVHAFVTSPGLLLGAATQAAGGAAGDFNGDGLHDLFVLGGGMEPDRMFVNRGDGTFHDLAPAWGLDRRQHGYGASAADFDGDGDLDLFVTAFGPVPGPALIRRHLLLRNDGAPGSDQRVFVNIADGAGLNSFQTPFIDGTGSGWGDYNLDGRLDLMVCGYRNQHAGNRLYRNEGPDDAGVWRFTDTTAEAGVNSAGVRGFLPRFTDLNGDRYPELILVGDSGTTRFLVNNTDGTFTERPDLVPGLASANAMGVDIGDINNDGLLDWYVTNIQWFGNGNLMMVQQPDGSFRDRAALLGVLNGHWGWGTLIKDLDHDGHADIAETNGGPGQHGNKPSLIFMNDGDGASFTERGTQMGFIDHGQGRGLLWLDIENDGDLDLVILNSNEPMRVFRNGLIGPDGSTPPDSRWLRVVLDTRANPALAPQGVGAMVRVVTGSGERIAPMDNQSNHCTTSPTETPFGLGDQAVALYVRVAWPDGSYTTLTDVPADQVLTISARSHAADFDGSGVVDAADLVAFVGQFTAGDMNADTDGNWRLDFGDVMRFIATLQAGM
jgi:hypothetical protein